MRKIVVCLVAICCALVLTSGISACERIVPHEVETEVDTAAVIESSVVDEDIQTEKSITEDITEVNNTPVIKLNKKLGIEKKRDLYTLESPISDREMLALVIYQEAGGDACCDTCRYRVADVVLNRVESDKFPNTIYEVLTQYRQYGRLYWTGLVWPSMASYECEAYAVERAYRIAEDVLSGNHSELYGEGYIWQAEFTQGKDNIYHCGHYFGR